MTIPEVRFPENLGALLSLLIVVSSSVLCFEVPPLEIRKEISASFCSQIWHFLQYLAPETSGPRVIVDISHCSSILEMDSFFLPSLLNSYSVKTKKRVNN
ncbi:hypothetical protein CDAR_263261 [Caerostris darwini]|uniref:Uncharacterized protein n=1 Tax=Caerostris darwini TaxID=1538125 RepID=A0AAV4RYT6_9ARAC|nr:hypothetical protein CDAR_263261 [Caerostris darwini]